MTNILYVLQQSIYNSNGKWLTGDSNINMALDLFNEMNNVGSNYRFIVLIAPLDDFANLDSYSQLYDKNNVVFVPYKFPVNAITNRFNFDTEEFARVYKRIEHDYGNISILWNNIPCLTRNMKTTLKHLNSNPKIITCNYWLDAPEIDQGKVDVDISYDWRQFDGFECSDLCIFTCYSTYKAWVTNARYKFNQKYIDSILSKFDIWDFGYSEKKVRAYDTKNSFATPTILFLNRLSGINYTNHEAFINSVNELWEERQDFQVFFTNPSNKVSTQWLKDNVKAYKPLYETPLTRSQYFELLQKSHISCHLFYIELYGGCASRESIASNNLVIAPNINEYSRILGRDYEFYTNLYDLKYVLSKAIDKVKDGFVQNKEILNRNKKSSFEYVVSNDVIVALNQLLRD